MIEEQARIGDSAWGAPLHSGIVAHYLLEYGTDEQKERFLPRLATGEMVGAIAMTEPGTGSDLQSVTTKASRVGDEYVVNGSKTFITNGAQADLIIVVAKTDPSAGANGISLVLVEGDRPGFRRGRVLDKVGQRGQDTSELYFEDVHIPVENLLGTTEGQGFIQLMQQLPQERLILALGAVTVLETALEFTVEYTKDRHAFGKPVFAFKTPSSSSPRSPPTPTSAAFSSTTASPAICAVNSTSPPSRWRNGGLLSVRWSPLMTACSSTAATAI